MATKAVGIPVAQKSARELNKDRMAAKRDRANKDAGIGVKGGIPADKRKLTGAAAKASANKKERPPKTVRSCACGCGEETLGYFAPGHDARFKGWLRKIEKGEGEPSDFMPKKVWGRTRGRRRGRGRSRPPTTRVSRTRAISNSDLLGAAEGLPLVPPQPC
jgi:hypothetical protein